MRHGVKINLASIYNQQDILLWKSSYRRSTNVAANRYSTAPGANDATTAKNMSSLDLNYFQITEK
jgi:hypothetical protein